MIAVTKINMEYERFFPIERSSSLMGEIRFLSTKSRIVFIIEMYVAKPEITGLRSPGRNERPRATVSFQVPVFGRF